MDSPCEGHILLVGDGDFSFTVSLLKHTSVVGNQITTSNLETPETIQQHKQAAENMTALMNMSATVLLETDACELHTHPVINKKYYHRIIFNFPLADRHNIKKNRSLLADFFFSCSQILAENGQVMVTLCKGQGGTPADQPLRSWHDSWQVLAMATNAGFILTRAVPFNDSLYPGYHSVGFRFQDKSFNTEGALTHIFEKADIVSVQDDFRGRGVFSLDDGTFSCSQYIADKLSRNLLLEESNPLCLVRRGLEKSFKVHMNANLVHDKQAWCVVEGHQSKIVLRSDQLAAEGKRETLQNDVDLSIGGSLERMKEKKNEANICTMMKDQRTLELKHGVENGSQENVSPTQDASSHASLFLQRLIPGNPESVYILIKNMNSLSERETDGVIPEPGLDQQNSPSILSEDTSHDGTRTELKTEEDSDMVDDIRDTNRVHHYRTSLLENLEMLFTLTDGSETGGSGGSAACNPADHVQSLTTASSCVLMSGQCLAVCSIQPDLVPLQHEMIIVQKLSGGELKDEQLTRSSESPAFTKSTDGLVNSNIPEYELASSCILSALHGSNLFSGFILSLQVSSSNSDVIEMNKSDYLNNIKFINIQPAGDEVDGRSIGIVLNVTRGGNMFCVCLIKLDAIVANICCIMDPRLLYSSSSKFTQQFREGEFPKKLSPFSLYPMKFAHDLSFWENGDFAESELYEIIRCAAGDLVVKVTLIDLYNDASTGRFSRCYRLHFLSHDRALSYLTSWKLQSVIRMSVAHKLKITLR
ncbi:unnamed protein product [Lymnaea stagnalis]|uniref:FDX-ACB domain-containing protein n=1 Tax=Lymnaea stagnalis TaxID=6523 RepID=A0AAV2HI39_LYMST